jgi:hypothetical protein
VRDAAQLVKECPGQGSRTAGRVVLALLAVVFVAIGCRTPGHPARIRGVLEFDEATLSACDSGVVYDVFLASAPHHLLYLKVKELEARGASAITADIEGELHSTRSMTRTPGRQTLLVSRVVALEAGACGQPSEPVPLQPAARAGR